MMKKCINILCIISLLVVTLVPTTNVYAAKGETLRDYKNNLAKVQAEKEENNRLTNEAKSEIDRKRNAIVNANNTISSNEQKVEASKTLVAESKEQIKIKTEELKDVINVLQYTEINSDEIYMDYIFDSSSIPELMERQAVVEQIITYTQQQLDDLDALIKKNEVLQDKLNTDNENLKASKVRYAKQVEELEAYIDSRASIGMGYDEKIRNLKEQIKTFEAAGCKDSDKLDDCFYNKQIYSSTFSRPLTSGRVTQQWGNNGHKGMDLGGNAPGTNVYAPANGTVAATTYHSSCGGNIIYIHFKVGGVAYTGEFAHLRSIKVKVGDKVTKGQVIGTVGGDSSTWYYDKCTSGTHLHYAIAYGYYLGSGADGYTSWSKWKTNTKATSLQSITGLKNQKSWTWNTR